jgi:hypothetical protein
VVAGRQEPAQRDEHLAVGVARDLERPHRRRLVAGDRVAEPPGDLPEVDHVAGDDEVARRTGALARQQRLPLGERHEVLDARERAGGVGAGPEVHVADHQLASGPWLRIDPGQRRRAQRVAQRRFVERQERERVLERRRWRGRRRGRAGAAGRDEQHTDLGQRARRGPHGPTVTWPPR